MTMLTTPAGCVAHASIASTRTWQKPSRHRSLGPRFRFYDLVRGAAVEWRRTHAVWTLIDEGTLVAESPEAILDRTWLLVTQSMKEAA
ncbi:hypothetical protein [Aminobacter ciceronei]|uniref:Uncharacterized protein n=1 Tax=Aminobacter ciceronei TaxID=150723 RepID=A0ABR6CHB6_9HYPH|nr:hypothetical protein [Aminobacter ciceronei]MBA8910538.1 hypothetical protein [Aminobacter ciceronei]MBA9024309.1 hypothetical protein [Aminobacter ciceronei]